MKILCLLSLIFAITLPLLAQFPSESIVITSNACINDCLKERSFIFAADNLRNFRKIILHIEEFCDTRDELLKCAQLCTNEEQQELAPKTLISTYICKDKLEEFRLVKECMERQDDDGINKCITDCGHPFDAAVQLDSSPAALVNPTSLTDNTTEICRTTGCVVKCSIKEFNKICAGSGYLFRDIGLKQVTEASKELQNIAFNSTSVNQQSIQLYLETLPYQCTFLINPINYNTTFGDAESDNLKTTDVEEDTTKSSSTMEEGINEMTVEIIHTSNDDVITRLFATEFTTQSTIPAEDDKEMKEPTSSHGVVEEEEEEGEKSTISTDDQSKDMEDNEKEGETTETDHEGEQESEGKQEEKEEDEEMDNITKEKSEEEMKSSEETDQSSTTERTIVVVNDDDKDSGIDTNTILQQEIGENKNRTSEATRERITLSLLIILPISSLYFSN
ncbi:Sodium/potassium/calcium exchanger [Dirofilaria immitis]